jgi:hypothetical protein
MLKNEESWLAMRRDPSATSFHQDDNGGKLSEMTDLVYFYIHFVIKCHVANI